MESLVLRGQGLVDRWSRWLRLSPPAAETSRRRFLIVQIDGLSRPLLERALAGGSLRGLRRLLDSGRLVRRDLSVGLPSSTPTFQAAVMYGGRPDIPGFHFYDKRAGRELHFPKPSPRSRATWRRRPRAVRARSRDGARAWRSSRRW